MYAILRVQKLKSFSNISGANSHNKRIENAPNANEKMADQNIHIGAKDAEKAIKKLLAKHKIKPRKNAVLANEYLLTASPEFFKNMSENDLKKWANDNLKFLQKKHGKGLISFDLHLDESTPHIHAIVCPLYENNKGQIKLSASHYFDRNKLKSLQTEYADCMEPYGLERGIENSKARHKDIKKYYGELDLEVSKATENAKHAIKEFKAFDKAKPSIFSYKKVFNQAKSLVKKLASQILTLEKMNAALKNKFEHKIEQIQGQMQEYKKSHEQLERLYDIQKLSKDDTERFEQLESRCVNDAEKRAEDDLRASQEEENSFVLTPAQALNIDAPSFNKPLISPAVKNNRKIDIDEFSL